MKKYAIYGAKDSIYIMATDMQMALSVYMQVYERTFGEPVLVRLELT